MSQRLDRIEAILETTVAAQEQLQSQQATHQLQIDVLVENQLKSQQEMSELKQIVASLAKSVQAHCDDTSRHSEF